MKEKWNFWEVDYYSTVRLKSTLIFFFQWNYLTVLCNQDKRVQIWKKKSFEVFFSNLSSYIFVTTHISWHYLMFPHFLVHYDGASWIFLSDDVGNFCFSTLYVYYTYYYLQHLYNVHNECPILQLDILLISSENLASIQWCCHIYANPTL